MQREFRTIVRFHTHAAANFCWTKKINYFVDRCSNDCYTRVITNNRKGNVMNDDVVFYKVKKKANNHWEAFANGKKMVHDMPFFKTKKEAISFLQRYYIRYEIENTLLLMPPLR